MTQRVQVSMSLSLKLLNMAETFFCLQFLDLRWQNKQNITAEGQEDRRTGPAPPAGVSPVEHLDMSDTQRLFSPSLERSDRPSPEPPAAPPPPDRNRLLSTLWFCNVSVFLSPSLSPAVWPEFLLPLNLLSFSFSAEEGNVLQASLP